MDHERFRDWFSRVDELTAALPDPPEGRCRGARRAVFAGSGARTAGRRSVR